MNCSDKPEKGKLLLPDFPLTYRKSASCNFDPHAETLYALNIFRELIVKQPNVVTSGDIGLALTYLHTLTSDLGLS